MRADKLKNIAVSKAYVEESEVPKDYSEGSKCLNYKQSGARNISRGSTSPFPISIIFPPDYYETHDTG